MVIDPASAVGKIRLRIGDFSDLPILPDLVIESALTDSDNNIPRAAALCAQYILGTLTAKTHRKLSNLEVWGSEHFEQYVKFLKLTILNPNLMASSPVPYTGMAEEEHPIIKFQRMWNEDFAGSAYAGGYDRDGVYVRL